jgi:FkbM family methyltransferase
MNMREAAVKAWVGIWYVAYVVLRALMRLLIGKRRRNWVLNLLGIYHNREFSAKYSGFLRYEPRVYRVIKNVLSKKNSRSFVDLGAFIGLHTIYAYRILRRKKGFTIIAVEPNPHNYQMLLETTRNIAGIRLVGEAIFIKDNEEVEFYLGSRGSNGLSMSSKIIPSGYHVSGWFLTSEVIKVRSVRLDTLIRRSGLDKVDLVKMDIEGAEYQVLTDPSLDLSKIDNLVVEVHYRYGSRESWEIMRALARHGFKIVPLYSDPNSNSFYLLACRSEIPW